MKSFTFEDKLNNQTLYVYFPEDRKKLKGIPKMEIGKKDVESAKEFRDTVVNYSIINQRSWEKKCKYKINQSEVKITIEGNIYEALDMLLVRGMVSKQLKEELLNNKEFLNYLENTKHYELPREESKKDIYGRLFSPQQVRKPLEIKAKKTMLKNKSTGC